MLVHNEILSLAFLICAGFFLFAPHAPFWAIPAELFAAGQRGAAMGMISLIGNIGAFIGPYAVGYVRQETGSFTVGAMILVGSLWVGALLATQINDRRAASRIAAIPTLQNRTQTKQCWRNRENHTYRRLSCRLRAEAGARQCFRHSRRRDFMLVAIRAADGTTGWGEVFASPYAAGAFLKNNLASTILGQPAQNIGRIWHDMVDKLGYDRRGAAMMAVSAVDMALHDLVARVQGISVAELLGGAIRQQFRPMPAGHSWSRAPIPTRPIRPRSRRCCGAVFARSSRVPV